MPSANRGRTQCLAMLALGVAACLMADAALGQVTQRPPGATSTSTRTRGAGGDPNIRSDDAPNIPDKPPAPEPPGKRTRAVTPVDPGQICVDSRVDLHVKIYVGGAYVGTVSPFGDSCGYYGAGDRRLYARAVFTDGSAAAWGPMTIDATNGFRWTIRN
jgi:hypothetical protein